MTHTQTPPPSPLPSPKISLRKSDMAVEKLQPSDFYMPVNDREAKTERTDIRLSPSQMRALEILRTAHSTGGGQFGWVTLADTIRWCLWAGAAVAERHLASDELSNVHGLMQAELQSARRKKANQDFGKIVQEEVDTFQALIQGGDVDEAKEVVRSLQRAVGKMDSAYWSKKYTEMIEAKFGGWLRRWEAEDTVGWQDE